MNTFGTHFRLTTFGESHGRALGAVIDGCPAGLELCEADIQRELNRRKPGQSAVSTPRQEKDQVQILSGVFEGKTTGAPIAAVIFNEDQQSKDYNAIKEVFRPGHADETWQGKFGLRDYRGGGRQSGRETVSRVIGGAIAKKLLAEISETKIIAHTLQIGSVRATSFDPSVIEHNMVRCADPKAAAQMEALILQAKKEGDSLGGLAEIIIQDPPKWLGEPVFDKLEAQLAKALMSVGATRSVSMGEGWQVMDRKGSEQNPHREGISGGISTGEEIRLQVAVKPTPSISKTQQAKKADGSEEAIQIQGRHDPVIVPRFIPVAEAMVALVLADFLLAPARRMEELRNKK